MTRDIDKLIEEIELERRVLDRMGEKLGVDSCDRLLQRARALRDREQVDECPTGAFLRRQAT